MYHILNNVPPHSQLQSNISLYSKQYPVVYRSLTLNNMVLKAELVPLYTLE